MAHLTYSVVDAFTAKPFQGNAAAVLVLSAPLPDPVLQNIAAEFNLSETAFVIPTDAATGKFSLRWFTPAVEVGLCGHATLAASHILFSNGTVLPNNIKTIEFHTNISGILTAKLLTDGRIELEFPAGHPISVSEERRATIKKAMKDAFSNASMQPAIIEIQSGLGKPYDGYLIIEIDESYDLAGELVKPDSLSVLAPESAVIIVTQRSKSGYEAFKSRVFAPASGIPEDPVTGSAHSILGPYWLSKLDDGEQAKEVIGHQVSKRGGEIGILLNQEANITKLRGNAVTVCRGELFLPD